MLQKMQDSAEMNADIHAEYILTLYRAWKALKDGTDKVTIDGFAYHYPYAIGNLAVDIALSVEVRGPWHTPCDAYGQRPDLFRITLTTGDPGLRILGNLNGGEPDPNCSDLQIQDWGLPWQKYRTYAERTADDWDQAFSWFLSNFYYG